MTPETNHDVDISIYYDYLEDQGIIVDREEEDGHWTMEFAFDGGWVDGTSMIASVGSFSIHWKIGGSNMGYFVGGNGGVGGIFNLVGGLGISERVCQ